MLDRCSPPFYPSPNFESVPIHDAAEGRLYWTAPNVGVFTLQSLAASVLVHGDLVAHATWEASLRFWELHCVLDHQDNAGCHVALPKIPKNAITPPADSNSCTPASPTKNPRNSSSSAKPHQNRRAVATAPPPAGARYMVHLPNSKAAAGTFNLGCHFTPRSSPFFEVSGSANLGVASIVHSVNMSSPSSSPPFNSATQPAATPPVQPNILQNPQAAPSVNLGTAFMGVSPPKASAALTSLARRHNPLAPPIAAWPNVRGTCCCVKCTLCTRYSRSAAPTRKSRLGEMLDIDASTRSASPAPSALSKTANSIHANTVNNPLYDNLPVASRSELSPNLHGRSPVAGPTQALSLSSSSRPALPSPPASASPSRAGSTGPTLPPSPPISASPSRAGSLGPAIPAHTRTVLPPPPPPPSTSRNNFAHRASPDANGDDQLDPPPPPPSLANNANGLPVAPPSVDNEEDSEHLHSPPTHYTTSTHASRHPARSILLKRTQQKWSKGPNWRADRLVRKQTGSLVLLGEDIREFWQEAKGKMKQLSQKHKVKPGEVRRRFMNGSRVLASRRLNSYNVKITHVMAVLNADREVGKKLKMKQVKTMIKNKPKSKAACTFRDITPTQLDDLMEEAERARDLKRTGVRGDNKSAATDAVHTLKKFAEEMVLLEARSNLRGFAFFTRGHLNDTSAPVAMESGGALRFLSDVFKKDPAQVSALFELWSTGQQTGTLGALSVDQMRSKLSESIKTGLQLIINDTKANMNYNNYISAIVKKHNVVLTGWPESVPLRRMSLITRADHIRLLYKAWTDGTCHWARADEEEVEAEAEWYAEMVKAGLADTSNARKTRADKNQTHNYPRGRRQKAKSADLEEEEEEEDNDNDEEEEKEDSDGAGSYTSLSTSGKRKRVGRWSRDGENGHPKKRARKEQEKEKEKEKEKRKEKDGSKKRKRGEDRDGDEGKRRKKSRVGADDDPLERLQAQMSRVKPKPAFKSAAANAQTAKRAVVKGKRGGPPGKWNGAYFARTSLRDLGLRLQVGHYDGSKCGLPPLTFVAATPRTTLATFNFSNAVSTPPPSNLPAQCVTFACLDLFQTLSLRGKTTAYDFYASLESLTNGVGLKPPDRYRVFLRVSRQYRHLMMLKRAGRGHDRFGVMGTAEGELALRCPACPRPGVNLPEDRKIGLKCLYTLYIAMDACFRLKRRLISSWARDPGLGTGWAYMIAPGPYLAYIASVGDQKEMSTCSGLAAIDHANDKFSRGYAVTGVGIGVCARHEFILPTSVGDLQKGERYANMDFIFMSFMRHFIALLWLVVSYDIACQWSKNLRDRLAALPPSI
ncbi:CxC2 domain-containing protein [Mycena kentingensis (nom. inval.)]|nr:CxC2 domain-containing protein [Mycena kentingensis (nom. inval.)]